ERTASSLRPLRRSRESGNPGTLPSSPMRTHRTQLAPPPSFPRKREPRDVALESDANAPHPACALRRSPASGNPRTLPLSPMRTHRTQLAPPPSFPRKREPRDVAFEFHLSASDPSCSPSLVPANPGDVALGFDANAPHPDSTSLRALTPLAASSTQRRKDRKRSSRARRIPG